MYLKQICLNIFNMLLKIFPRNIVGILNEYLKCKNTYKNVLSELHNLKKFDTKNMNLWCVACFTTKNLYINCLTEDDFDPLDDQMDRIFLCKKCVDDEKTDPNCPDEYICVYNGFKKIELRTFLLDLKKHKHIKKKEKDIINEYSKCPKINITFLN